MCLDSRLVNAFTARLVPQLGVLHDGFRRSMAQLRVHHVMEHLDAATWCQPGTDEGCVEYINISKKFKYFTMLYKML